MQKKNVQKKKNMQKIAPKKILRRLFSEKKTTVAICFAEISFGAQIKKKNVRQRCTSDEIELLQTMRSMSC
jgi:hypothetical protein